MPRNREALVAELVQSAQRQADVSEYQAAPAVTELPAAATTAPVPVAAPAPADEPAPSPPPEAAGPQLAMAYGVPLPREAETAERLVQLAVRVPESMRLAIKMCCLMHNLEMQDFAREAFERELRRRAKAART